VSRWLLAAAALLLLLTGTACQADISVGVDTRPDGSGVVRVAASLDKEAATAAGKLSVDDLKTAGWTVDGPRPTAGGGATVTASKPFGSAAQARSVVAEVAGTAGPFKDFTVSQHRSLFTTRTKFTGTVDIRPCLGDFSDPELRQQLGGNQCLGLDPQAVKQTTGVDLDNVFRFTVTARLPGSLTTTNAPVRAGNGAVWRPTFGQQVRLSATSRSYHVATIVFLACALAAGLALLVVLVVRLVKMVRRRPAESA